MLPNNKLLLLWYVKWLCKLMVSNTAGRKMWMWRIACHTKLRNSWTKNSVLEVFVDQNFQWPPMIFRKCGQFTC